MKNITFKILNMHCASCAMNIDGELEDTPGVKSASSSYAKGVTQVEFDEAQLKPEDIIAIIKKTGYEVVAE